jgi:hypothetical protein
MRSALKRSFSALLLSLLAVLVLSMPAAAGVRWCHADPIVRLNGTAVQFWVAIPEEYTQYVNGPIDIKIEVPRGVTTELLYTDPGFNGHGEKVMFGHLPAGRVSQDGSFDVRITVKVPFNSSAVKRNQKIPVMVDVTPSDGVPAHVEFGHNKSTTFTITVRGQR